MSTTLDLLPEQSSRNLLLLLKMTSSTRKYAPIWEAIKRDKSCQVKIPDPILFPRVRQGVIKEKNSDVVFRIENHHVDVARLAITFNPETKIITFELKQRYGILEMKVP